MIINGWIVMLMQKIKIFYYPEENLFRTNDNKIIINLQPLVTPNQIFLFKHHKKTIEFINGDIGVIVVLLYPIERDDI